MDTNEAISAGIKLDMLGSEASGAAASTSASSEGESAAGTDDDAAFTLPAANKKLLSKLVRSKGFAWLASYHTDSLYWSHAGTHFQLASQGRWWAATQASLWPKEDVHLKTVLGDCKGNWGDRRQEIVMIGINMDVKKMTALLDSCLLSDAELKQYNEHWQTQAPDPATPWSEYLAKNCTPPIHQEKAAHGTC